MVTLISILCNNLVTEDITYCRYNYCDCFFFINILNPAVKHSLPSLSHFGQCKVDPESVVSQAVVVYGASIDTTPNTGQLTHIYDYRLGYR